MGRRKKKKVLEKVEITGIADKGRSVGRDADGQVVFVDHVAPGDVVDVLVLRKKKGYHTGVPQHFHQYSGQRVQPFCEHFEFCGGCKWQHLEYQAQAYHKQLVVENALRRIGKVAVGQFLPILAAEQNTYYRNKLEFSFGNRRWLSREEIDRGESNHQHVLGFHPPGAFDKVIDIRRCWLQGAPSNELRNGVRELALAKGLPFFDAREHRGLLRTMMVRTTTVGESMLLLSFYHEDKKIIPFLEAVQQRFPELTTLCYCINPKANDSIYDIDVTTFSGPGFVTEKLGRVQFHIGPKSFFQTNTRQAERLYERVRDFAGLSGRENVYDLYTGIGSIALYLADCCERVVGIEEVPEAIADAERNARLNGIDNVTFYAGDVKALLTHDFAEQHGRPEVLITDPPRAGMHPDVVQMLYQLAAPRLVYVSCNPATQARDLQVLSDKYEVCKVQPVDMFPHTHHVENVALLEIR